MLVELLSALALGWSAPSQELIDRVVARAGEGDYTGALALVDDAEPGLASDQARVWLLYRARDHVGALAVIEDALTRSPDEPWLLERRAACLLNLGKGIAASEAVDATRRAVEAAGLEAQDPWPDTLAKLEEQSGAMAQNERAAASARGVARAVAGAALALALVGLIALAWPTGRSGS